MKTPKQSDLFKQCSSATATVTHGDCLEAMRGMAENSVDSVVTDPPYGLGFMGKDWDHGVPGAHFWVEALRVAKPGAHLLAFGGTRTFHRLASAIEDAGWELRDTLMWVQGQGFPKSLDIAWSLHLEACVACGVMVEYDHHGDKSAKRSIPEGERVMRFVRAIYVQTPVYACAQCGQVLQPCLPEHCTSQDRETWSQSEVIWGAQSGVERRRDLEAHQGELQRCSLCTLSHGVVANGAEGWVHHGAQVGDGSIPWEIPFADGSRPSYRPQSGKQLVGQLTPFRIERRAQEVRGTGTALKPAWEPIILARKPLEGTVAQNVLKWGVGGLNIDTCRIPAPEGVSAFTRQPADGSARSSYNMGTSKSAGITGVGRWPANLIHDGSSEVVEMFPESQDGVAIQRNRDASRKSSWLGSRAPLRGEDVGYGGGGSAARFFYCAKASQSERNAGCTGLPTKQQDESRNDGDPGGDNPRNRGAKERPNHHPTVKPVALMRYLCKLVTPPGGLVLDPFCGSGTTLVAAINEGFNAHGIELQPEYVAIANARVNGASHE